MFPVQKEYYKTKINREAVVVTSIKRNRKLQEKLKRDYTTQYENKEISLIEYEKRLKNRPKFHSHALRHFFINTIRAYCSNRDISLIMEAHTSDIQTDENYMGESKDLFSKEMIKKHYLEIMNHLTFSIEIDPIKLNEIEQVKKENEELRKENKYIKMRFILKLVKCLKIFYVKIILKFLFFITFLYFFIIIEYIIT